MYNFVDYDIDNTGIAIHYGGVVPSVDVEEMLCPQVWNFTPPAHHFSFKKGGFNEEESKSFDLIDLHFFNHLVNMLKRFQTLP